MSASASATLGTLSGKRRVLVVENHRFFRENLVQWIANQEVLECCGEAETVADAQHAIGTQAPDLVLLDLTLRESNGLDLLRWLEGHADRPPVIVLSQCDEHGFAPPCLAAGARGFVSKSSATEELQLAIETVFGGGWYISGRGALSAP